MSEKLAEIEPRLSPSGTGQKVCADAVAWTERLADRFPWWTEACKAAGIVIPESTPRTLVA